MKNSSHSRYAWHVEALLVKFAVRRVLLTFARPARTAIGRPPSKDANCNGISQLSQQDKVGAKLILYFALVCLIPLLQNNAFCYHKTRWMTSV